MAEDSRQTRLQPWGQDLGVRIPKELAEQLAIGAGSELSLSVRDGALVVRPALPARLNLEDLLAEVTPDNLHACVDTGEAIGQEIV